MAFPVHTWPQVKQLLGTCLIISQVRNNSWRRAGSYQPFHQVGVLRETPPLLETLQEPPVADDARPELPRDVVLLPLEPPAHLAARSPHTRFNFTQAESNEPRKKKKTTRRQQAMRSGVPGGWWTCSWVRRSWRRTPRWAWWACAARRRGTRSPSRPRTPSPRPPWVSPGGGWIGERELPLGRVRRGGRRRNLDRRRTAAMWGGEEVSGSVRNLLCLFAFPSLFRWNFQGSRGGAAYSYCPIGLNLMGRLFGVEIGRAGMLERPIKIRGLIRARDDA